MKHLLIMVLPSERSGNLQSVATIGCSPTAKPAPNASAVLYSLVVTAKMNGINPYQALVKLFDQIPVATSLKDFERLADLILKPEVAS